LKSPYQVAIYTRFNLPLKFGGVINRPGIHLKKKWLDSRVELFNKYCLPSVKNQTDQNFTWFICFAENTPPEYVNEICTAKQAVPIFANSQGQSVERSREHIIDDSILATIRLDSDDSISLNYIDYLSESIKSFDQAIDHENYVLAFTDGCEYDLQNNKYYSRLYLHSPFIALCEKTKPSKHIKSVFADAHYLMHRSYKTLLIPTEEPMWRINIHDDNVANKIKGELSNENFDHLFSLT